MARSVDEATGMSSPTMRLVRRAAWLLAGGTALIFCFMAWGGNLLVASDPLPEHLDAAVVLQGSIVAEKARLAAAINLLQRGVADRVLLSVPKESYWGQSIPPLARAYIERNYGSDPASRIDFCETTEEVNSTAQEAQVLSTCIHQRHWESIVIVTSNYHTRRARILWRRVVTVKNDPKIHLWVDGANDPEFSQPWWRYRQSAKIWLSEVTKLCWTIMGGR
jgi:uncharacterized SAM-binding protein YcdF (DUF218 family)